MRMIGFVSEENKAKKAEQEIIVAIKQVLRAVNPTEERVRLAIEAFGYQIRTLDFKPHVGAGGEIYGGKQVEFRFYATAVGKCPVESGGYMRL